MLDGDGVSLRGPWQRKRITKQRRQKEGLNEGAPVGGGNKMTQFVEKVQQIISSNAVVVFSKTTCGSCYRGE